MMPPDKGIDPARVGLSKSLMTTPCERKAAYGEFVRDSAGRRLQFPMPERVLFGRFIDAAHAHIVWHDLRGEPWSLQEARIEGMKNAASTEASEPIDWQIFELQAANALDLFVSQPDGLDRIRTLYGLDLKMQVSLRSGDLIGTPDYTWSEGVLDVKATARTFSEAKFWTSAEMAVYSRLWASENGEVPKRLVYQQYVRKAKPEWKWLEAEGTAGLVALGEAWANRWRVGLSYHDPDVFSFNTAFCGDCPWKNPIPDVGHEGCVIGQNVPVVAEEAA